MPWAAILRSTLPVSHRFVRSLRRKSLIQVTAMGRSAQSLFKPQDCGDFGCSNTKVVE